VREPWRRHRVGDWETTMHLSITLAAATCATAYAVAMILYARFSL
jgi:hypothetical protein